MRNVLVTLADSNYIDQAKQLFSSVYWNAEWDGDYLLLAHDISEDELLWFREKGILIYNCDDVFDRNNKNTRYPMSVFSKSYLFKEYFKQWKKIVYLDADIIVTYSLNELLKIEKFGAKPDLDMDLYYQIRLCIDSKSQDDNLIKSSISRLQQKYDLTIKSFNSGVMIIDSSIIDYNSFDNLKKLLNEYIEILGFADQFLLNLYMYKKWEPIDYYYNTFCINQMVLRQETINPVLHFVSHDNKPWNKDHTYFNLWKSNLDKAENINLKEVQKLKKVYTEKELNKSRKILKKIEDRHSKNLKLNFLTEELDQYYLRGNMKRFRSDLISKMIKGYSKEYNRFIPYFFISYIPTEIKKKLKKIF